MRKQIFRKSIGGTRNSQGLFGYTPFSVGDDSYYKKTTRYFNVVFILKILDKKDEGG